jgi:putative ABC transport system substrate-binding protein
VRRREFLGLVGGAAATWPLTAYAQQSGRVWRIGLLETVSATTNAANLNALRQGLRDLGYVEGSEFIFEYRSAEGKGDRFADLAIELVRQKVDVSVTRGTPAVIAAKAATATIPVVMAAIGEPLLVITSLARPGGNVTGLSAFVTDLQAKRVDLLKNTFPDLRRIAALLNMGNPNSLPQWKEIEAAANLLGLQSQLLDVRQLADFEVAFDKAAAQHAEAIIVGIDVLTQMNAALIATLALKHRMVTIYASREFVDAGGLIAYGVSYPSLYRRSAAYIDKIFKGARPGDLPVEQPTKFELVINLKTAKILGLTIPDKLLFTANEVIE